LKIIAYIMKSSLFWDVTDLSAQPIGPSSRVKQSKKNLGCLTLEDWTIDCPETSVTNL
jgi:hypothetical protein